MLIRVLKKEKECATIFSSVEKGKRKRRRIEYTHIDKERSNLRDTLTQMIRRDLLLNYFEPGQLVSRFETITRLFPIPSLFHPRIPPFLIRLRNALRSKFLIKLRLFSIFPLNNERIFKQNPSLFIYPRKRNEVVRTKLEKGAASLYRWISSSSSSFFSSCQW